MLTHNAQSVPSTPDRIKEMPPKQPRQPAQIQGIPNRGSQSIARAQFKEKAMKPVERQVASRSVSFTPRDMGG